MSRWLVRRKSVKTILGPFSSLDVVEKLKSNEIQLDDYICEEGFATWTTLDKRKDIIKLSELDIREEYRKSRESVDAASGSDDIVLQEDTSDITPDQRLKSRTWIRWLALGLVTVIAIIIIRLQLSPPVGGGLSPAPSPKEAVPQTPQEDALRTRKGVRPAPQPLDPNAATGVSRFTTISPVELQEQTGGTLQEGEGVGGPTQDTRRRIQRPPPRGRRAAPARREAPQREAPDQQVTEEAPAIGDEGYYPEEELAPAAPPVDQEPLEPEIGLEPGIAEPDIEGPPLDEPPIDPPLEEEFFPEEEPLPEDIPAEEY